MVKLNAEKKGEASSSSVSKLQEQLKAVEVRLRSQAQEQKKHEDAMGLIKRDSGRCKELEASIDAVSFLYSCCVFKPDFDSVFDLCLVCFFVHLYS